MNSLLLALAGAVLATRPPVAVTNRVVPRPGISVPAADPKDPVEPEFRKLLAADDEAQAEADKWIGENKAYAEKGAGITEAALSMRIRQRFESVRRAYEDFIQLHPKHVGARLAYGSFLGDLNKDDEAVKQWERARELDPLNPAALNNLANYYGHQGPVTNAFALYDQVIELNPKEPVYYQNLATTVFLFRKDAMEYYRIDEQKVFDRSLALYRKALDLDPDNFVLASDLAQTYYGIKPQRLKEALTAWQHALKVAGDDIERQGVYLHLARLELGAGQFDVAWQHLHSVTNSMYDTLKSRLVRNLEQKQKAATNAPPASPDAKPEPASGKPPGS